MRSWNSDCARRGVVLKQCHDDINYLSRVFLFQIVIGYVTVNNVVQFIKGLEKPYITGFTFPVMELINTHYILVPDTSRSGQITLARTSPFTVS